MTPGNLELGSQNTAVPVTPVPSWFFTKGYRCHVSIILEEDGSFSAVVLNLPGAGSCGVTEKEALDNLREAVLGVIESHVEAGEDIPWLGLDEYEVPGSTATKWILVNA